MYYQVILKEIHKPNQVTLYEGNDKTVAYKMMDLYLPVTALTPHLFIKVIKTEEKENET